MHLNTLTTVFRVKKKIDHWHKFLTFLESLHDLVFQILARVVSLTIRYTHRIYLHLCIFVCTK